MLDLRRTRLETGATTPKLRRDDAVEPAGESPGVGVFEIKRTVATIAGHADHLPIGQIGGGFDHIGLAGRANKRQPGSSVGSADHGLEFHAHMAAWSALAEGVNNLLSSLSECGCQGRVEGRDQRVYLVLEGGKLIEGCGQGASVQRGASRV